MDELSVCFWLDCASGSSSSSKSQPILPWALSRTHASFQPTCQTNRTRCNESEKTNPKNSASSSRGLILEPETTTNRRPWLSEDNADAENFYPAEELSYRRSYCFFPRPRHEETTCSSRIRHILALSGHTYELYIHSIIISNINYMKLYAAENQRQKTLHATGLGLSKLSEEEVTPSRQTYSVILAE